MADPDIFDPKLLQRLTRPLVKPGVINPGMARQIILRSQLFANRLPLLAIAQRHYNRAESQTEQLPIVYARSLPLESARASSISLPVDGQSSPSEASQTTVVQAKSISPKSPTALTVNPKRQPGVTQAKTPSTSMPLASSFPLTSTPSLDSVGWESIPIVYAQSLPLETARASDISLPADGQSSPSEASQTMVVQAKRISPKSPTSLTVNPTHQPGVTQALTPTTSVPPTSAPSRDSLGAEFGSIFYAQSLPPETARASSISQPVDGQSYQNEVSQTTVVQAKSISPKSPTSLTVNAKRQPGVTQAQTPTNSVPPTSAPSLDSLGPESVPIVYARSRQDEEVNKLTNHVSTTQAIAPSLQPPPLPKLIVRANRTNSAQVNTPLVFSSPPTAPELPNRGIDEFSMSQERSPVTQESSPLPNWRSPVNPDPHLVPQIDIDTLAAKVERKLMRKLIVENERRGRNL